MNINKRQTGVGLIEALIAALVFAFGITALVQLQGTFFKNTSAANARSMAMGIAQEKLEDLRGFQMADSADADIFDFTSIGTNTGGRCTEQNNDNACTLALASTGANQNIVIGNIGFSRNWTVTNYYYDSAGALTSPVPTGTNTDQKQVTVNVTWTDTDGSPQTLALEGLINRNSGASIGTIANTASGGSGYSPVVPYTPSNDPHVTPIGVGIFTKRETLVPSSETVSGYSRTKFVAYTYDTSGKLVREEEFQNVACDCRFDGTSTDDAKTYTAAHPIWSTAKNTYVDVDGDLVSGKVKGCVQGGGSNCASNPDPLCNVCCRDHHDTSSATFKFDPFRSSDDFVSGNHKHYSGTLPVTSGPYLEACRMKRVDGNWRVFEDWHMVKFTALPLSDLIDTTIKATYADYVQDIIDEYLDESKVAGQTLTTQPTKPTSLIHTVSSNYVSMSVGDKRELTGRAIYLDYVDSTHLTNVKNKKSLSQDYLLDLPFYELEVATLTGWTSSAATSVKVGPFDGPGSSNDLIGGELHALATDSNAVNITGSIKKSNSGVVALSSAVDYNATTNRDSLINSDVVSVCLGCSAPASCTSPWGSTVNSGASVTAYQTATVPYGQTCASQSRACTNGVLSGSYQFENCTVNDPTDCTTPWGSIVTSGNSVTAYQAASVPDGSSCTSQTRSCSNGILSGSYTNQSCTVQSPTDCVTPWGATVSNGNSATAFQSGTVPFGSTCASQTRTCSNGTLSGSYTFDSCSVQSPAKCTAPWGETISHGDSVLAYLNSNAPVGQCNQASNVQTRTCNNGVLSGSYTNKACQHSPTDCTLPWGDTLSDGSSATAFQSATVPFGNVCVSESRTCSSGNLSGSYTNKTCSVLPSANCTTPWGSTVNNGSSTTAYLSSTVPYGSTCTNQTRTCTNGVLSGSYTNSSCTVQPAVNCTTPWGSTVNDGSSTTAYQTATVPFGSTCTSQTRSCTNGTLSGSYSNPSCTVQAGANCTTPWGTSVLHGSSVTAYLSSSVSSPNTCSSESRSCSNGTLSGTYANQTCTVTTSTCSTTVVGKAAANSDTVSLSVNGGTGSTCSKTGINFSCTAVTTALDAIITVTNAGSINSTVTVSPICGAKTVNF